MVGSIVAEFFGEGLLSAFLEVARHIAKLNIFLLVCPFIAISSYSAPSCSIPGKHTHHSTESGNLQGFPNFVVIFVQVNATFPSLYCACD